MHPEFNMRMNFLGTTYSLIAFEHYYNANKHYENVKIFGNDPDCSEEIELLYQDVISTIIFSCMTIESFLNDYAAACLGDDIFYDSLDSLTICSKLVMISKFILHQDNIKQEISYALVKEIARQRNEFVHNKSLNFSREKVGDTESVYETIDGEFAINHQPLKRILRQGLISIKAMYEVAKYFDKYDRNAHAITKIITLPTNHGTNEYWTKIIKSVLSELRISLNKMIEIKL